MFKGSGCSSSVGRQGGMQRLKLGPNCASNLGVIIHELMHAIGNKIMYISSRIGTNIVIDY